MAYLNTEQAAREFGFVKSDGTPDRHNLLRYLVRHKVPMKHRGRTVIVRQEDIERTLTDRPLPIPAEDRAWVRAHS